MTLEIPSVVDPELTQQDAVTLTNTNSKYILITGGSVSAHIDDIRIISNISKGKSIAALAENLARIGGHHITYLTERGCVLPNILASRNIIIHNGFEDYRERVLELAPKMDAIILGAAVTDFIPAQRVSGKIDSHNLENNELLLQLKVAPKIIEEIRTIAPRTTLIGFKLTSNKPWGDMINAAYKLCLCSKANVIIANDLSNLNRKYAVTKEDSVIPMNLTELPEFLNALICDEWFNTIESGRESVIDPFDFAKFHHFINRFRTSMRLTSPEKYLFGSVAVRCYEETNSFITTTRGKNELDGFSVVQTVIDDGIFRQTIYAKSMAKPSMNAPLLHHIFSTLPEVKSIVHIHQHNIDNATPMFEYAFPGTVRDSNRKIKGSFQIRHHGWYQLYNIDNKMII